MQEFGIVNEITLKTDASAAKGIAMRRGMGKVRHIKVNQLWVQDKISKGEMRVAKISGDSNVADHLTSSSPEDSHWPDAEPAQPTQHNTAAPLGITRQPHSE